MLKFVHTFGSTLPLGLIVLKLPGTKLHAKLVPLFKVGIKEPIFNHKTSLKSKVSMTYFHPLGKEILFCLFIARKGLLVSGRYLAISLLALKQTYEPESHSLGLSLGCGTETEKVGRPKRTLTIP